MKKYLLQLTVFLLRMIYLPLRLRRKQDRILFLSRQSNKATIDVRMLYRDLQERYPDIPCTILARQIGPGLFGLLRYIPFMLRQMSHLAVSRVVILDGYCIPVCILPKDAGTCVIQLWHAIAAVKKFGYQTIDMPSGHSRVEAEVLRMHRNYDHVVCCSEAVGQQFMEGFQVGHDRLLFMGLPRIDAICGPDAAGPDRIRQRLAISGEKEMILYVPTFRRNRPTDWRRLARVLDPDRFTLVLKLHELDVQSRERMETDMAEAAEEGLQVISGDGYSTYQWLRCCDRIITDYSSLGVEAALTDKPVYFYVEDIEEYSREVGLNIDPGRELPGQTARTAGELAEILARPWDPADQSRFRDKYISVSTDRCTGDLADFAAGLLRNKVKGK